MGIEATLSLSSLSKILPFVIRAPEDIDWDMVWCERDMEMKLLADVELERLDTDRQMSGLVGSTGETDWW